MYGIIELFTDTEGTLLVQEVYIFFTFFLGYFESFMNYLGLNEC